MRSLLSFGICLAGVLLGAPSALSQTLEITAVLRELRPVRTNDGIADATVESYGVLVIDGAEVWWNDGPCRAGGCLGRRETTDVTEGRTYQWQGMYLRHSGGAMRTNNNRIVLRRVGASEIARPFIVSFTFRDHDSLSQDDLWCEANEVRVIPPGRGIADWLGPSSSRTVSGRAGDGDCRVTVQLFGKLVSLR